MAFVHSTGFAPELLWPGINKIYGISYDHFPTKYTKFFQLEKSDKAFEKDQGMTGFPLAAVKEQGNEVFFSQMYQGYQKEYLHLTYSIGAAITSEMVDDDQYNVINKIPKLLAESLRQTEETVATSILNNGFSSSYVGADGQPLFSASHPLVAGGTFSNQPTTSSDLTQTSLEQAMIDIMGFVDDQGLRINIEGKTLVVPRQEYFNAMKLLGTQYEVNSANNAINPLYSDVKLDLVVSTFLTDSDAWFVKTSASDGLKFFTRREAELQKDNDFNTGNLKIKTSKRFSAGFTDPRGMYGSAGA